MNQYFFNVTKEERENILDKHKTTYDGYVTQYGSSNMTPLTVQDLANDKKGITVNNRGEVSEYKNVAINEMRYDGKSTGLFEDEEDNYLEVGAPLDMIADREDDVKHGTVDFEDDIEFFDLGDVLPFSDEDYKGSFDIYYPDSGEENDDEVTVLNLDDDFDEDLIEPLQEQLDKTREMFLRFNKYN
jgi:hypothetical protein